MTGTAPHNPVPEVLDTTRFCSSFPEVFGSEVWRDNVLHIIDKTFEGETQLLIVEGLPREKRTEKEAITDGREGIGKTVLLAQFARRNAARALSIFIRPTSWFAYDPGIVLRDLCNQMHWILTREELPSSARLDDAFLANLVYELQRHCKRQQSNIVFVVDGITDIPKDRLQVRDVILSKLPFGLPQFRFLFSGYSEDVVALRMPKIIQKTYTLSPFSLEETVSYFGDKLSRDTVTEVFKVSHGVPGYLAGIRRLLDSGTSSADLLDKLPNSMPDLFALEWQGVLAANADQLRIVALLAHDRNKHTLVDLAMIFQATAEDIRKSLESFSFLSVPARATDEVEFVSDTYRRYAAQRLSHFKEQVSELVISSLLRAPDSDQALSLLPIYLQDAGQDEALLSYLSSEHLGRMLEKSQLPSPVQQRARLGVETALRLRRDEDLTRLGIDSSVIAELDVFQASRSEIEARFALGDLRSCISLAQTAVVKDDRLRLLALIARKVREKGSSPESELLDQIEQLAKEVDFSSFTPERAVELAADLIHARPELAIIVLERTAEKSAETKQASLDWALARISIHAILSGEREIRSAAETFKTRIKDPDVARFSAAAALLFGTYTASDVIAEVDKIKNPERKLALLRQWALSAANEPNAAQIVEYAINLAGC